MTETFYDVLGVGSDATTDEIESAYRDRLKETHPDVSDDEDAGEVTQKLIEARDVLVDEEERERYDRIGHAAYVGDEPVDQTSTAGADSADQTTTVSADQTSQTKTDSSGSDDTTAETAAAGAGAQDRGRRERRARQRVSQERRQTSRDPSERVEDLTGETTTSSRTTASDAGTKTGRKRAGSHATEESVVGGVDATYSVREDVSTPTTYGPLLPSGHQLTLLGIFLALYPVLLFSTLMPAFPLVVNLVVGCCLLATVAYLQSMPRVGLLVFGSWSAIAIFVLLVTGIGLFSITGLAVLLGTVMPFSLSVLTASALRY